MTDETTETRDYTKERDDRCVPLARELLKIIADQPDLQIGSISSKDEDVLEKEANNVNDYYTNLVRDHILNKFIESDLTVRDVNYTFTLMLEAIDMTKNKMIATIDTAYDIAVAKKFGHKYESEVLVREVNDVVVGKTE